jgi:hypothetical protein
MHANGGGQVGKRWKFRALERVLFAMLLASFGAAGFFYQRFRTEVPDWQLVSLIVAGMGASYGVYRLALTFVLRKLTP